MGLFDKHPPAPDSHKPGQRNPPDFDRQRAIAATVGYPREFMAECVKARYDLDTLQSCVRPPPANAAMMAAVALHGGAYSKQELAMHDICHKLRLDFDAGYGEAKQCCDTDQGRSNPSMDDSIRSTAQNWLELARRWDDYKGSQNRQWAKITKEQVGPLAAQVMGLFT